MSNRPPHDPTDPSQPGAESQAPASPWPALPEREVSAAATALTPGAVPPPLPALMGAATPRPQSRKPLLADTLLALQVPDAVIAARRAAADLPQAESATDAAADDTPLSLHDGPTEPELPAQRQAFVEVRRWDPPSLPPKEAAPHTSENHKPLKANTSLPMFTPIAAAEATDSPGAAPPGHRHHKWVPGDEEPPAPDDPDAPAHARTPRLQGVPALERADAPHEASPVALIGPIGFSGGTGGSQSRIAVDPESLAPSRRGSNSRMITSAYIKVSEQAPNRWIALSAKAGWLGLAILLAAVVVPLVLRARARAVEPRHDTLARAAELVGAQVRAGDALAFVPSWGAHEPWLFRDAWQRKGLNLEVDLLQGDPLEVWGADGHQRLWVVATHGELQRVQLGDSGAKLVSTENVGHGTGLALYSLPPSQTRFDFRKQLHVGRVRYRGPEAPAAWRDCAWRGDPLTGKHACSGQEYQDVWQTLQEVGGTRREAIYLHPPSDKGTLQLRYVGLPSAAAVQGRVGNRLWAVRHGDVGSKVRFRVLVGDQARWEQILEPDDFGWYPWSIALRPEEVGRDVTFEVYADNAAWREVCLDARLVGAAPGEVR